MTDHPTHRASEPPSVAPSPLDGFIPNPDIRERHTVTAHAPADRVQAVARAFDMQSVPLIRVIVRARQLLLGTTQTSRTPRGLVADMTAMGWGILLDRPGELLVAGAVCQPWKADVVFRPVPPDQFAAFNEPNQVRIAWTLETRALGPNLTELATETRAAATDATSRRQFRHYWSWARFGIIPIRWFLLPAVARRAERPGP